MGQCKLPNPKFDKLRNITQYVCAGFPETDEYFAALFDLTGPFYLGISTQGAFDSYESGIYNDRSCGNDAADHAMVENYLN